jgi:hypothetical protein
MATPEAPFGLAGDPLPRLGRAGVVNGEFRTSLVAYPGDVLDVDASTNLPQWTTRATVTNETGTSTLVDPAVDTRFYRARLR